MKEKIESMIIGLLKELNNEFKNPMLENPESTTKLFGVSGTLDSLGLVLFLTELEELISEGFDADIVLADEKAMSQTASPFRNIKSLTVYIENIITEE